MKVVVGASFLSLVVFGFLVAQQQSQHTPGSSSTTPPAASSSAPSMTMTIDEFDPKSTLVVPEHIVKRAKYPFIDIHNHQRDFSPEHLDQLLREMDSLNMQILVNSPVNGSWGERTKKTLDALKAKNPHRFASMTNVDFKGIDEPGYSERIAKQLQDDIDSGAVGLKVWRNFGMYEKDSKGERIHIDDPRYDAVWDVCAKNNIPILIHTADPKGLFMPMDKYNERWLELKMRSGRNHMADTSATWDVLMTEQHNMFRRHPKTKYIAAHMDWLTNDLGQLGKLLDEMPNMYVEIGAITSDLGRQPRFARQFFIKYQDRILFGKDLYSVPEYYTYFRLLETADEYFDPIRKYHGLWKLYGLDLPDDVLKKLYYKNALRVFPKLDGSAFPK